MPTLEILLYVLPRRERQSAVPTGILVRLFPGSRHQWLSDQHATTARPSVARGILIFIPGGVRQDIPTFFLGPRIDNGHHARLALALRGAGWTPGTRPLVRTASVLEHAANGAGANCGELFSPQGPL